MEIQMQKRLIKKISQYIDAGFPILYINSFEDDKIDSMIEELGMGKEILEWNGAKGLVDFKTKNPQLTISNSLATVLDLFLSKDEIERKIMVLKDIHSCISEPEVIAKLKIIVNLINQGTDATIIIISSVLVIPPELEKYITILEMDYLSVEEIKALVRTFMEENQLPMIKDELLNEFAVS